eukprot:2368081-Heterocapsa_arctica.AAC.1
MCASPGRGRAFVPAGVVARVRPAGTAAAAGAPDRQALPLARCSCRLDPASAGLRADTRWRSRHRT